MDFIKKIIIVLSVALSFGIGALMISILLDQEINGAKQTRILVALLIFLVSGILIALCIGLYTKSCRYEAQNAILQIQLKQEQSTYTKVNEIYEQARMMNHDIKHYLSVVLGLLENKEYEEARQQIIDLVGKRMKLDMVQYVASSAINAVLNEKLVWARNANVNMELKVSGKIPGDLEMDVAIILANLLDNAIEAVREQEDKRVELDMYELKGMYYVTVRNTIHNSILQNNPAMSTTKEEKEKHGIGLNSVRYLVKRMDGSFQMREENGWFLSYVSFPIIRG